MPSDGHRAISMTKPPPFLSNWNETKSIVSWPIFRKCGNDPENSIARRGAALSALVQVSLPSYRPLRFSTLLTAQNFKLRHYPQLSSSAKADDSVFQSHRGSITR